MAEEWRVSLIFHDHSGGPRKSYFSTRVRDLLRSRVGADIAVSDVGKSIFLYAGDAATAEEAERAAREVLAQQNLTADVRLERWDPSGQEWRDPRAGTVGRAGGPLSAADEKRQRQGRQDSADRPLPVNGVVDFIFDFLTGGH